MRWALRSMALAVAALILIACSSIPSGGAGAPLPSRTLAGQPMTACMVRGEIPVKAEVAGLCGTLSVPEDRSTPGGRRVSLRVAVVPALAAAPRADPFFAIAGGPGEASTQFFAWLPGLYADIHATRDIVLVDQRGTGASNPLTVPAPPETTGLSASQADIRVATWLRDARASLDADPRFYTSTAAADDLDDVRAALGYDRIDLYGTSYGGTLAQYYLRQHGDHVRVAVLDGATPIDVPVMERIAPNSQAALELLFARCAADAACHAAFPRLADEWSALVARLATGIRTTITDPQTGEQAVADLLIAGAGIHQALLTGAAAAQVPLAIHLSTEDRWDLATPLVPAPPDGDTASLLYHEIMCSEPWARFDPAEVERVGAGSYALLIELARARTQAAVCRSIPRAAVAATDGSAVRTTIPVLWLTGDGDPQDPPANLTAVTSQQANSRIVVMPAQEHVVGHLGCGPAVIAAFVEAGTPDGLDTGCIAQGASPNPTFRLR